MTFRSDPIGADPLPESWGRYHSPVLGLSPFSRSYQLYSFYRAGWWRKIWGLQVSSKYTIVVRAVERESKCQQGRMHVDKFLSTWGSFQSLKHFDSRGNSRANSCHSSTTNPLLTHPDGYLDRVNILPSTSCAWRYLSVQLTIPRHNSTKGPWQTARATTFPWRWWSFL